MPINNRPIDEYGTGVVKGYEIGPNADLMDADLENASLRYADLRGANLNYADLCGANLYMADLRGATMVGIMLRDAMFGHIKVDAHNLHYFESENSRLIAELSDQLKNLQGVISTIEVSDRKPNPGQPHSWGPHHDSYYDHPSVKDHVAISITPAGRAHLKNSQGPSFHLIVLERLCQVPSLPQFVLEGELGERGVSGAMLHSLSEEGLITAFIEDRPARPRDIESATEYSDDDHNLEYQHRKMLRLRHPNPGYGRRR